MTVGVAVNIQQRTDTAANWTSANPILLSGEIGWESDTNKSKLGNGTTAWASLPYTASSGSGTLTSLTVTGNTVLGDLISADTVTFTSRIASHLIPSADDTYDIGTTTGPFEWRDLYIDGTANIDTGSIDVASIGALTVTGATALNGATTIGDAAGDALTVTPSAVTWSNNPTHSGNHTFSGNVLVNGNTTIGNAATDTVTVTADVASTLLPSAAATYNLGSATDTWARAYVGVGALATPSVSVGATTCGIYSSSAGVLGLTGDGVLDFRVSSPGASRLRLDAAGSTSSFIEFDGTTGGSYDGGKIANAQGWAVLIDTNGNTTTERFLVMKDTNDPETATQLFSVAEDSTVVCGGLAALATNATAGHLYVPTCAGVPTGVPTAYTGKAALIVDTSNNRLYFYSGGSWRNAGP